MFNEGERYKDNVIMRKKTTKEFDILPNYQKLTKEKKRIEI